MSLFWPNFLKNQFLALIKMLGKRAALTLNSLLFALACSSLVLDEVEKQSTCELEVDAVAVDILNRLEIESKIARDTPHTCRYGGPLGLRGRETGERFSAEASVLRELQGWNIADHLYPSKPLAAVELCLHLLSPESRVE